MLAASSRKHIARGGPAWERPGARPAREAPVTETILTEPITDTPPPGTPGAAAREAPASLQRQLKDLWRELPGLVSDRVELLSLELQRAAQSLAEIVALIVGVAILGVTVWLVLWAALIALLVGAGLNVIWAMLLAIAVNGLVIVLALQRVRKLLPRLKLPGTRRHLMVSPDPTPQPPSEDRPDDRPAASVAGQPVAR
jgi:hypothetical protein